MKQILILSLVVIVSIVQFINATEHNGFESEEISVISSAELEKDLENLRNERVQSELDSSDDFNDNEAIKQKRGRRNYFSFNFYN